MQEELNNYLENNVGYAKLSQVSLTSLINVTEQTAFTFYVVDFAKTSLKWLCIMTINCFSCCLKSNVNLETELKYLWDNDRVTRHSWNQKRRMLRFRFTDDEFGGQPWKPYCKMHCSVSAGYSWKRMMCLDKRKSGGLEFKLNLTRTRLYLNTA